jgi:hypothetical protein
MNNKYKEGDSVYLVCKVDIDEIDGERYIIDYDAGLTIPADEEDLMSSEEFEQMRDMSQMNEQQNIAPVLKQMTSILEDIAAILKARI